MYMVEKYFSACYLDHLKYNTYELWSLKLIGSNCTEKLNTDFDTKVFINIELNALKYF